MATQSPVEDRHAVKAGDVLFNPRTYDPADLDPESRRLLRATIEWFESRGKGRLKEEDRERVWYQDYLDFLASEGLLAKFLTPAAEAGGDADKRWDTARICEFNEISAFYGLQYWYTWQVTILGLGPIWQSANGEAKARAARLLDEGSIFAFGLSEKAHGADIYSTDMVLTPEGDGFRANGGKYYIGNGNKAGMVSVFGRRADVEGEDGYVFFAADSQHPNYRLVKNVVNSQNYVSQFELEDYPVRPEDVMHTGREAFDAALNTVNVGKFNLGFASIGICEHALYEAITHADARILYGRQVTDFSHVRQAFTDAYARLVAMKLFSRRAIDYFRSAGPDDRRYLLFNPITKMKVTTEGERVIDLLWDVLAAKGFEKDMYFEMAARDIRGLPKLEGTVHVNMALVLKFMANYLFAPDEFEPVPERRDVADDEYLFRQGPARGLSKVRFQDWRPAYAAFEHVPNVKRFAELAEGLRTLLETAPPAEAQATDLDFLLTLGELFTLVPYGQLILERAAQTDLDPDTIDQIFDVFVRDFSAFAVDLHGKASSTDKQQAWALDHVRKPVVDHERATRVFEGVRSLAGTYEMRP
ncbi:MAG: acyl-CoA dehydrogenase [Thermoleophilaceae bacterium]|nr:acyl-CoA dehydrogenase [Thermoleophilaceae bacterium]